MPIFTSGSAGISHGHGAIYVGNLALSTSEREIRELFEPYGQVLGVKISTDRETGRPIAFVEMRDGHMEAVKSLHGHCLDGCNLPIENRSRFRPPRRV